MALVYLTKQGDVLDAIVFQQYGACTSDSLNAVLDANYGLTSYGPCLPMGIQVTLPDPVDVPTTPPASNGVALWD